MQPFEFEKVVCEVLRYQVQQLLSKETMLMRNSELKAWIDQQARGMILELRTMAVAKHRKEEIDWVKYPSDWWEAFKERWFPKWMLRRWPVNYKRKVVQQNVYHCCPHMDIKVQSNHIEFLQQVERGQR